MLYLREWRLHKRLTLKDLACLTKIDFRTLSKYELGNIDPVSERLTTLAKALGVDEGELFKSPPTAQPTEESVHV